jgi:hypothetical protein
MKEQILKYIKENPGKCHGQYLVRIFGDEAHDIIDELSNNKKIKYIEGFILTDTAYEYKSDGRHLKEK